MTTYRKTTEDRLNGLTIAIEHELAEEIYVKEIMKEISELKLSDIRNEYYEVVADRPGASSFAARAKREYKSLTAFRCNSFTLSVSSRVLMSFKILLPHQHYPLAAMVGKDGKLYFRLVEVGTLVGHSKAYGFAKRFDNLVIQGKDV
ncbi:uncharacterized protein TNCV_3483161 [Trichonephila clavipes]|nr:uncharacterized protein TNCV_3483161 [Trichonephila clavipes]